MVALSGFLKSINWSEESYPAYQDYIALPIFALFFLLLRSALDCYIFENIARLSGIKSARRVRKFKEQAWVCVYYISSEILAAYVAYEEPWFTNTRTFWLGPGTRIWPDQPMKLKLKAYYMYQAGFYLFSIYSLHAWDTRRSDFLMLMFHHISAIFLLSASYILRLARVGTVVLVLHDVSDIFLAMGKCFHYTGQEELGKSVFVVFVVSWILTRLVYYPFWVLWSTCYDVIYILHKEKTSIVSVASYGVLNTLLLCLLLMHLYWSYLIYGMAATMQRSGTIAKDVRSDSEDEHQD